MNFPYTINKDTRRTLHDWGTGNFKQLKTLYIHEETEIGNHYHRHKDEIFFLASGKFIELQVGALLLYNVEAPHRVEVPRLTFHKFICEPGSILFGAATEEFDPNDEIKP
jgi:mannose-6-phosphate isomerase-like protein (cupin superfamily)